MSHRVAYGMCAAQACLYLQLGGSPCSHKFCNKQRDAQGNTTLVLGLRLMCVGPVRVTGCAGQRRPRYSTSPSKSLMTYWEVIPCTHE